MNYMTMRNFETHQEIRLSMSEFSKRYIELKRNGFQVTNRNNLLNSREKFIRLAYFTAAVNPKSPEVEENFMKKGWSKGES